MTFHTKEPRRSPVPRWALVTLSLACAPRSIAPTVQAEAPAAEGCDPERDRAAILRMAGSYQVEFAFEETVSLSEGYAPRAPYRTTGTEWVAVLEDKPGHVSLQHVLVVTKDGQPAPLKHWRQDWTFEDTELLEFHGRHSWEPRALSSAEARCTWSQAVFEVDDGPRYEGSGRWSHARGVSSWQSSETWRPLPRREYTKRSDYDVLTGTNRHALTPTGWVHEQDSLKVVLGPVQHALVRERGLNVYTRLPEAQGLPEASAYWTDTQGFWSEVRQEWQVLFRAHPHLTLRESTEGRRRSEELFALADTYRQRQREGKPEAAARMREQIRATLERFVERGVSATASQVEASR